MEESPRPNRGVLLSTLSDLNENVSSCCFDIFETKNKVIPTLVQIPGDFDFIEISPQRRLRIINIKPFKNVENETTETVGGEEDLSEEEYWFENAAPDRLPVIQPQPDLHLPEHQPAGVPQLHHPPPLAAGATTESEATQPGDRLDLQQQNILHAEQEEVRPYNVWCRVEAQRNSVLISFCRVFTSNLNLPIICR